MNRPNLRDQINQLDLNALHVVDANKYTFLEDTTILSHFNKMNGYVQYGSEGVLEEMPDKERNWAIYHGTPFAPWEMAETFANHTGYPEGFCGVLPLQSYRLTWQGKAEPYQSPGVCAGVLRQAIGRSLIHRDSRFLQDWSGEEGYSIAGVRDASGASRAYVPFSLVEQLANSGAHGYLLALDRRDGFEDTEHDTVHAGKDDQFEKRSPYIVSPRVVFRTQMTDLDPDIVVTDARFAELGVLIKQEVSQANGVDEIIERTRSLGFEAIKLGDFLG